METKEKLIKILEMTVEEGGEIFILGIKQGVTEGLKQLRTENQQYQELIEKALRANEGTDEWKKMLAEIDDYNKRYLCEATAGLEEAEEASRKSAENLKEAREASRKSAENLKGVLKNQEKGK